MVVVLWSTLKNKKAITTGHEHDHERESAFILSGEGFGEKREKGIDPPPRSSQIQKTYTT